MGNPFVASYSGGKDSILAIHRAVASGMILKGLITTYNSKQERSWFHNIPKPLLEAAASSLGVPLILIDTQGEDYNQVFEATLVKLKADGVSHCVFGDIDIIAHRKWGEDRAAAAGMTSVFPLWQQDRRALVEELLSYGYRPFINIVNQEKLPIRFLGQELSSAIVSEISETGADCCGENGEYHTFVFDGPLFRERVSFLTEDRVDFGYTIGLPLKKNETR